MLPATEHPALSSLAIAGGAHFVCSSYLSSAVAQQGRVAAERGLVLLTECGLDPGLDHLYAHLLVRAASAALGDRPSTARFTSYCGSNPAEANEFRYRFSWAPRGVLTALLSPARSVARGREVDSERPWEAMETASVAGELFEVYPNRDSIPFVDLYQLPPSWALETFVRGSMRLDGWSVAWKSVFDEIREASPDRLTELAQELADAYPTTPTDHDRVVMAVRLEVSTNDGTGSWQGSYTLDVEGTEREDATARLVSMPLAIAILDVVAEGVPPGLHQASDDESTIRRWLNRLAEHGIKAVYQDTAQVTTA